MHSKRNKCAETAERLVPKSREKVERLAASWIGHIIVAKSKAWVVAAFNSRERSFILRPFVAVAGHSTNRTTTFAYVADLLGDAGDADLATDFVRGCLPSDDEDNPLDMLWTRRGTAFVYQVLCPRPRPRVLRPRSQVLHPRLPCRRLVLPEIVTFP